ncbi:hypothetical protein ACLKA6_012235 [Drosophila palustris]
MQRRCNRRVIRGRAAGCASAINTNKVTQIQACPMGTARDLQLATGNWQLDCKSKVRASHGFGQVPSLVACFMPQLAMALPLP